jgi:Na+/phosphate symporter
MRGLFVLSLRRKKRQGVERKKKINETEKRKKEPQSDDRTQGEDSLLSSNRHLL